MTRDQVEIVLIASGWAAGVGAVGLVLGYVLRRRSLRWLSAFVAVVAVVAVLAGIIGTARAMFLSTHDFEVVLLVCLVAGVVSLVAPSMTSYVWMLAFVAPMLAGYLERRAA